MTDTEISASESPSALLQCARCGHKERMTSLGDCSICSGELRMPLPTTLDLGVDLSSLTEGVDTLPVHRVLARYVRCCNIKFMLGETVLMPEQVLQPEAIMPVISIEAMRIWQSIERRPGTAPTGRDSLEVEFVETEDGFFPLSAYPADIGTDLSSTLRMLVFLLAARRTLGLVEGSKIDLAPYIAEWDKIDWSGDVLPDIPMPKGFDAAFQKSEFSSAQAPARPVASPKSNTSTPSPFASQANQGNTNAR